MNSTVVEPTSLFRNVVLLIGLFAGAGIISIPFAITYNLLPDFTASSARLGPTLLQRHISAWPFSAARAAPRAAALTAELQTARRQPSMPS